MADNEAPAAASGDGPDAETHTADLSQGEPLRYFVDPVETRMRCLDLAVRAIPQGHHRSAAELLADATTFETWATSAPASADGCLNPA